MKLGKGVHIVLSLAAGSLYVVGLLALLGGAPQTSRADPGTLFASVAGGDTACTQADPCSLHSRYLPSCASIPHDRRCFVTCGSQTTPVS